jgi:hypothetical protein
MWLVRVEQRHACFAFEVTDGLVTRAAPIAGWTVGKRGSAVVGYYRDRDARVTWQQVE